MNKRTWEIDFLKCIAITGVIAIHAWQYFLGNSVNYFIWNYLHFVVAAFIFSSGYILSIKQEKKLKLPELLSWLKKRAARLLVPYYLYLAVHVSLLRVFPDFFSGPGLPQNMDAVLGSLVLTGGAESGWLVLLFIQMALIYGIYSLIINSKKSQIFYFLTFLTVTLILPFIPSARENYRLFMWLPWSLILFVSIWAGESDRKGSVKTEIYLKISLVSFLLFLLTFTVIKLQGIGQIRLIDHKYPPDILNLSYGLSITLFLFYLAKTFALKGKTAGAITYIARNSYALFFTHYIVLDLLLNLRSGFNIPVPAAVLFSLVFIISMTIVILINRIKALKKIIIAVIILAVILLITAFMIIRVNKTGTASNLSDTPTEAGKPAPVLHELSVAAMRQKKYPGSNIVIEQKLGSADSYEQYIASYLSEGLKIYALLTVPLGTKPKDGWPIIVFNHGYIPPEIYKTNERYVAYIDAFARNGYVVFKPDYRGNGNSQGKPEGAYYSPAYTVDDLNAIASIKKYRDVNPQKLGVWGHSLGGNITLRDMVIDPEIKAAVIWGGVVGSYDDLMNNWQRRVAYVPSQREMTHRNNNRQNLIKKYGTPKENPDFWNSLDPVFFIPDIQTPVQLHHGLSDDEVPADFSGSLYEKLIRAGKTAQLFTYENADHNISGASFALAMERSLGFFDKYLKSE